MPTHTSNHLTRLREVVPTVHSVPPGRCAVPPVPEVLSSVPSPYTTLSAGAQAQAGGCRGLGHRGAGQGDAQVCQEGAAPAAEGGGGARPGRECALLASLNLAPTSQSALPHQARWRPTSIHAPTPTFSLERADSSHATAHTSAPSNHSLPFPTPNALASTLDFYPLYTHPRPLSGHTHT